MYNKFQPSVEERGFDATNFVGYLQEQLTTKGLYFVIQTVEDGSMSKVFWTLTDSLERWIENTDAKMVLYDTAHGTNKYTLKFAAFVQSKNMVIVFNNKPFRHPPKIIITDGDPAMAVAIRIFTLPLYISFALFTLAKILSNILNLFSVVDMKT